MAETSTVLPEQSGHRKEGHVGKVSILKIAAVKNPNGSDSFLPLFTSIEELWS